MRPIYPILALVLPLIAGCQRAGLSPHESQGQYQNYIAALYDSPRAAGAATVAGTPMPGPALSLPMRLAVAQLGEVTPGAEALTQLRAHPHLYSVVQPLPAAVAPAPYHHNQPPPDPRAEAKAHLDRMLRLAADLGADHLYLYGGTVDYGTEGNALSVLDLTIVGAFLVPGKTVKAQAKASGALIDVRANRVVFLTTAEDRKGALASTAASDNAQSKVLHRLRNEVVKQLVDNFIAETPKHVTHAAAPVPAAPTPTAAQPANPYWKN